MNINKCEPDFLLMHALRRILRPLVRLLVAKDQAFLVLTNLLEELYVSVAEEHLSKTSTTPKNADISNLTGIDERNIAKWRSETPDAGEELPSIAVGAEVVAIWTGSPEYLGAAGEPSPLPYINESDPLFSFSALAGSISADVSPRVMLEEMVRQEIVRYDEVTGQAWLNTEAFVPQEGWAKKLYFFGRNIEDHLNAAVTNILSDKPPYLDRSVYYSRLTKESAEELQVLARNCAADAVRKVNRRALELFIEDKRKVDTTQRVNFGTYFFSENLPLEDKPL